jgi:hypothetical protein
VLNLFSQPEIHLTTDCSGDRSIKYTAVVPPPTKVDLDNWLKKLLWGNEAMITAVQDKLKCVTPAESIVFFEVKYDGALRIASYDFNGVQLMYSKAVNIRKLRMQRREGFTESKESEDPSYHFNELKGIIKFKNVNT